MFEAMSYSWRANDGARIRVSVEPSYIYTNVCRFVVDPPVYPGGALYLSHKATTAHSPLARRIFDLGGVSEILIAGDSVTVTTEEAPDWEELGVKVASAVREQIGSGTPSVSPEHIETLPSPDEIRGRVEELIESTVGPAVASHGGRVSLLDVQGNNVYLEFGGGCQGCGMAHVTLKYGVERLIREHIPEVGEIFDTTDHAGGKNPYYQPPQPR